ncbi:hypothetical protein SEA_DAUBENSKI_88 [Streptomyces phage Daubenski]|uniref:DUF2922 domain-containing protein n=1 Tax=Streptomyces phage Daubenski TaxID=2653725 RepID=A0A5Q2WD90_9CAUD|nr:hypothetical protein KNU80_gp178 [Streptomyces phage Daubenski]QGH76396.1 hypothetical protein SEA_DAUBENSKI_88 [Streptomyces phage Daubenski]
MAKLIRLQFFRSDNGLLAYREYDDGSSKGGRVTDEEAKRLSAQLFDEETLGLYEATDLVKDEDERPDST